MGKWFALLLFALAAPAWAQPPGIEALREPGAVALLRHADAPGTGDPAGFALGDCATQRNLGDAGRAQARAIGARLRRAGVRARVFSSAWCRTRETADLLGLGPVTLLPALNSFFQDSAAGPAQTEALRRFIADWTGGPLILVTHQVNITALTGVYPRSGELVLLRRGPDGVRAEGRVQTSVPAEAGE